MVIRSEIRVDNRARSSNVPHPWPRPEHKDVDNISKGRSCGFQRLLDSLHTRPSLCLQVIGQLGQVFAAMRVIMIHRQRSGAGQPTESAAVDFDGWDAWQYDRRVVFLLMDH